MRTIQYAFKKPAIGFIATVLMNRTLRRGLIRLIDRLLWKNYYGPGQAVRPLKMQQDKAAIASSVLHAVDRGLSQGTFSRTVFKKSMGSFSNLLFCGERERLIFRQQYGCSPPGFLTISPTARCNLNCPGCYADSSESSNQQLEYETMNRILYEQKRLWGSHFTVISGGEPLLWKSDGKTIFDLAEEHNDTFFQMFTNGVAITPAVARQFARVGNITPAISVEGFEKETDARRGKGVHKIILQAFRNLSEAGVPFGISLTTTRDNAGYVTGDKFFDYYFIGHGALSCWIFQYMPIGRNADFNAMVTPEQRLAMYKKTWELIRERKFFIADFWNCGTVTDGCISAGIRNGYLSIDWNGNVMPCVFNPYYIDNITDVYARGETLSDVLFSPLFKEIRSWEMRYFHDNPRDNMGNIIAPCAIRDHFDELHDILIKSGAKPANEHAAWAMWDQGYSDDLIAYGREVSQISSEVWQSEYLHPQKEIIGD